MKTFGIGIVLVIWFFCTVIAAVTLVGLCLIVSGDDHGGQTTWMKVGEKLVNLL
jgi:uncharacterized membrane protein HdeD (DUF308 family)